MPRQGKCPKCSTGTLRGPSFCTGGVFCRDSGEHLHDRCDTCGYRRTRPCADQENPFQEKSP